MDDSLSEVVHVVTNDFISENLPSLSRYIYKRGHLNLRNFEIKI